MSLGLTDSGLVIRDESSLHTVTIPANPTLTSTRTINVDTLGTGGGGGGALRVYDKAGYNVITNTALESNICEMSIPEISLNGEAVTLEAAGGLINNTGAARTLTFRVYINGGLVYSDVTGSFTPGANLRGWWCRLHFISNGTATTNSLVGPLVWGSIGATTAGFGDLASTAPSFTVIGARNCNANTVGGTTIRLTAQLAIASTSYEIYRDYAVVHTFS